MKKSSPSPLPKANGRHPRTSDALQHARSPLAVSSWFLGILLVWLTLACSHHLHPAGDPRPGTAIGIFHEPTSPNFSVSPMRVSVEAGSEVAWINHTDSVFELTLSLDEGEGHAGWVDRMISKARGRSQDPPGSQTADGPLSDLEAALKEQERQIEQIREEMRSSPEGFHGLEERVRDLEETLSDQKARLSELKSGRQKPGPPVPKAAGFINPLTTMRVKFDLPAQYVFTLQPASPHRRALALRGLIRVLP